MGATSFRARASFRASSNLVRLPMAQFIKDHKVGLLVGATAGAIAAYCFLKKSEKPEAGEESVPGPYAKSGPGFNMDTLPQTAEKGALLGSYTPVPEGKRDAEWKALDKISTAQLVALAFDTIDSNFDGQLSRKELKFSSLGPFLQKVWTNIDDNHDLVITKEEWTAFCNGKEIELGKAAFKTFMVDMLWNADIAPPDAPVKTSSAGPYAKSGPGFNVDSLPKTAEKGALFGTYHGYTPVPDGERDAQWKALDKKSTAQLVALAFDTVDSNSDGQLSRKELKFSSLGPFLQKVWTNMDDNHDLVITKEEWTTFCKGKESTAELGPSLFKTFMVDMLWNADIAA